LTPRERFLAVINNGKPDGVSLAGFQGYSPEWTNKKTYTYSDPMAPGCDIELLQKIEMGRDFQLAITWGVYGLLSAAWRLIIFVIMNLICFGCEVYAVGSNPESARLPRDYSLCSSDVRIFDFRTRLRVGCYYGSNYCRRKPQRSFQKAKVVK